MPGQNKSGGSRGPRPAEALGAEPPPFADGGNINFINSIVSAKEVAVVVVEHEFMQF